MSNLKQEFRQRTIALMLSMSISLVYIPGALATDSEINFKVYNPSATPQNDTPNSAVSTPVIPQENSQANTLDSATQSANQEEIDSASVRGPDTKASNTPDSSLSEEVPASEESTRINSSKEDTAKLREAITAPKDKDQVDTNTASTGVSTNESNSIDARTAASPGDQSVNAETNQATKQDTNQASAPTETTGGEADNNKVLKGYVRVVPSGTKIPIIMDTAVDSDTSQEGDEFSARTAEDLTIDGTPVVPAGSIIRGRIAALNSPKHLDRSGSVALKFDTVTTPDNRQIPLVATIVARGGVVHARRGLKDIAIDTGVATLPSAVGLGIGAVAGHSSTKIGTGGGALIGAGVGIALGVAILLAKRGKKVDVRPGDELKIELAEDLHMPTL